MERKTARLFFIDAMRAWAILMMLQGHFIDGLLDPIFRDPENSVFTVWKYFRGITAPVFFTVSGFIFTYLLIRVPENGWNNPRIKKGIKRGLQLLLIGYLLRLNLFGLFSGQIYDTFFLVDVLHIIGCSILGIIAIYLLTHRQKNYVFPLFLLIISVALFTLEPIYSKFEYPLIPAALANYFTKVNGSVFTIIPWFGYTAIGGFLSVLFTRFKDYKKLYPRAIGATFFSGIALIFLSSPMFAYLHEASGIVLFEEIYLNNYLFIRLGDVLVVFSIFMLFRQFLTQRTILKIGQNTLSIYVIHFIILYGSFTGLGLYQYFHNSLAPSILIPAVTGFIFICSYAALRYDKHEIEIKSTLQKLSGGLSEIIESCYYWTLRLLRISLVKLLRFLGLVKN